LEYLLKSSALCVLILIRNVRSEVSSNYLMSFKYTDSYHRLKMETKRSQAVLLGSSEHRCT